MNAHYSSIWLVLVVGLAVSGCSSSSGASYAELESLAEEQRSELVEGDIYRRELAVLVDGESRILADQGIATGPIKSRRPFVGVRVGNQK